MNKSAINLAEKLTKFSEQWTPKIIAQMNDYHLKVVKVQGEFVWYYVLHTTFHAPIVPCHSHIGPIVGKIGFPGKPKPLPNLIWGNPS